ncbi:MAG: hypothetical protein WCY97_08745 [Methanothrix sp.]|jgi:ribosomal protein L9|uniref:Ribosomal protein L9 domain-containing protein n=1 Tax=Methanothrix harundinacea TaxID=301375 RepID=A0A101FUU9_9EURY|nr:MAG: hypothetical protein XD72_0799 [Methanothrix harundinacea]MDD2637516.1 hypothetical protein [Methanothrix sp.]MDI9398849.1 hypothetical protein [Euryarchaeota archaeon]KUK96278.1 MAG: hypothetical protein XE07_1215 [Methanothrix harundinacea]MCP1391816.1 hypothetical protein [Methanothrix harundinacea]
MVRVELLKDVEGLGKKGDRVSDVPPAQAEELIKAGKAKDLGIKK